MPGCHRLIRHRRLCRCGTSIEGRIRRREDRASVTRWGLAPPRPGTSRLRDRAAQGRPPSRGRYSIPSLTWPSAQCRGYPHLVAGRRTRQRQAGRPGRGPDLHASTSTGRRNGTVRQIPLSGRVVFVDWHGVLSRDPFWVSIRESTTHPLRQQLDANLAQVFSPETHAPSPRDGSGRPRQSDCQPVRQTSRSWSGM